MEHDDDTNAAPAMSEEQAAELRRLQLTAGEPNAEMAALEQAEADKAAAEQAAQVDQNSQAIRMGLDIAIPFLSRLYPSLAEVYDDGARGAVAMTVGPVLSKYGIDLGDVGGRYREEIAMAVVCGPIAMATYAGMKADIEARERRAPKAVASEAQQPPQQAEMVTLG
jgi:hypothetical protein